MCERRKAGQKFSKEEVRQSPHSPDVVKDHETVERALRREVEMDKAGVPTKDAFMMNQLEGRPKPDGSGKSGLSVQRVEKASGRPTNISEGVGRARAKVGTIRGITDREGNRTFSVIDAGTAHDPAHAEVFLERSEVEAPRRSRDKLIEAFGGNASSQKNSRQCSPVR